MPRTETRLPPPPVRIDLLGMRLALSPYDRFRLGAMLHAVVADRPSFRWIDAEADGRPVTLFTRCQRYLGSGWEVLVVRDGAGAERVFGVRDAAELRRGARFLLGAATAPGTTEMSGFGAAEDRTPHRESQG